jgi:hypothetical protein
MFIAPAKDSRFQIPDQKSGIWNPESYKTLRYEAGKMVKGSVIGALGLSRKAAGRKLTTAQVKSQTLATCVLVRTWFIRTIAILLILFLHAFHITFPF